MKPAKAKYILDAEDRTRRALDSASARFKRFGIGASKVVAGLAVILGTVGVKKVVEATGKQEAAIAQVEARLKSTKNVAGQTSKGLQEMAASLQKVTTFADESVLELQALILSFTNIRGETVGGATEAILDMSVAMNQGLKESAIQLGKALNDPVAGITALSRVGVKFTADQRSMIKSLVETGQVAEAQKIILAELKTEFGGAAKVAGSTLTGSLAQLKNAWGDLFEAEGEGVDRIQDSMRSLTETLQDPAVKQGINDLINLTLSLGTGVAKAAALITPAADLIRAAFENLDSKELGDKTEIDLLDTRAKAEKQLAALQLKGLNETNALYSSQVGLIKEIDANLARIRGPASKPVDAVGGQVLPAAFGTGGEQEKLFQKSLEAIKKQTEATTFSSEAEKVLWETQKGRLTDLTDAQKTQLIGAAELLDATKEKEAAEKRAITDREQLNKAAQSQITSLRETKDLLNASTEAERVLYEVQNGRYQALDAAQQQALINAAQELDAARAQQQENDKLRDQQEQLKEFGLQAARNIQSSFADFLFDPFEKGIQGMLDGFVTAIRRMVAEAAAAAALQSLFSGPGGGNPFSAMFAGVGHNGALVGHSYSNGVRSVPAAVFYNAPRFHGGGIIGANEVPIIAERGEEVLPASDPRHRNNASAQKSTVTVINKGTPKNVAHAETRIDARGMVVSIMLEDVERDGPVTRQLKSKLGA